MKILAPGLAALLAAVTLLAAVPLLALAQEPAPAPPSAPAADAPTVVFVLRHAEALPSSAAEPDPALAEAGAARARTLARLLSEAGATHLFASEFSRTQATLAPLAAATGLAVEVVPAGDAARQVAALRALPPGSVAVVAGHSNTVSVLVAKLGGEMRDLVDDARYGAMLPHEAHDRIAEVVLPAAGPPRTIELRYGD
jgi:phosphohistidine phosphatase SixA